MKALRHYWLLVGSMLTLLALTSTLGGAAALAAPVQGASSLQVAVPRSTHITPITYHVKPIIYHVTPIVHQVTPLKRGTFTTYTVPGNNPYPIGITEGPDKNLWFAAWGGFYIGKMTPSGTFTEYPHPGSAPEDITTGPDGNLWFTVGGGYIDSMTLNGTMTEYTVPHGGLPLGITVGSDGNLWFTAENGNFIASITTSGVINEYPIPTSNSNPDWIIARPNGTLWFTEYHGPKLGKFTISTKTLTEYPIPDPTGCPNGIASGLNGTVWFADPCDPHIGFIVIKTGKITEYVPPNGQPFFIALGPDKGYWYTGTSHVSRSSASGKIVGYTDPVYGNVEVITVGPQNRMWFTEPESTIGSVTTS